MQLPILRPGQMVDNRRYVNLNAERGPGSPEPAPRRPENFRRIALRQPAGLRHLRVPPVRLPPMGKNVRSSGQADRPRRSPGAGLRPAAQRRRDLGGDSPLGTVPALFGGPLKLNRENERSFHEPRPLWPTGIDCPPPQRASVLYAGSHQAA